MAQGDPVPMTLNISWSGLKRWEECNQLDYRVKQGQAHAVTDGRVFLAGTLADRAMRRWLENNCEGKIDDSLDELVRLYTKPETDDEKKEAQYVIKWRGDPNADRKKVTEFVREALASLEPLLKHWVEPYDYQPEMKFKTKVGVPYLDGKTTGINLIGGIDVVTRFEPPSEEHKAGRFRLFDLKTTTDAGYITKTTGQSVFYSLAFGHWIGDKKQPEEFGFIAPMLPNKIYWSTVTDEDRRHMISRIIRYAQGQWNGEKEPKADDTGCRFCVAYHVCDKYALNFSKDDIGRNRVSFEKAASSRTSKQEVVP